MHFIITEPTDQKEVNCGYCSNCGTYNEVWSKEDESVCPKCYVVMRHLPKVYFSIFWFIIIVLFFILMVYLRTLPYEPK